MQFLGQNDLTAKPAIVGLLVGVELFQQGQLLWDRARDLLEPLVRNNDVGEGGDGAFAEHVLGPHFVVDDFKRWWSRLVS